MNAFTQIGSTARRLEPDTEWQVTVVYEDRRSRDRAMALLHDLQKRFSGEFSFACTWWRFRYLSDSDIALVARHYAIAADIVIFSSASAGLLPLAVMNWVESWISGRRRAGGVLVPLIGSPNLPPQLYATKLFYLREVAERAHMDYLPQTLLVQSRGNRAANVIGTPTAHFDQ